MKTRKPTKASMLMLTLENMHVTEIAHTAHLEHGRAVIMTRAKQCVWDCNDLCTYIDHRIQSANIQSGLEKLHVRATELGKFIESSS